MEKSKLNRYPSFLSRIKSHQLGQTSVEYILLLAAMITIITSILSGVRDRLVARQNPCPSDDKSIGCMISRSVSSFGGIGTSGDGEPTFRFFTLR